MKVLVILGHPRPGSFAESLAEAYITGARSAGAQVHYIRLYDLDFHLHVTKKKMRSQRSEPDIEYARQCIAKADHLVFVYPTWWATMPALLKGFLDRVLLPGFAFEEKERNTDWIQLLRGKSAQLITTMDTPMWVYRILYRAPGTNAMRHGTLGYCGIRPVRFLGFSPVSYTTEAERIKWIDRVRKQGEKLKNGIETPLEKSWYQIKPWLKAIRLQFYPMTWIAYAVGGYGAAYLGFGFDLLTFWIGYLFLFFLEVAVVFSNDYHDYESGKINKNYSPFTGGSRVLIDNDLSKSDLKKGIRRALLLASLFAIIILWIHQANWSILAVMTSLSIISLGYTLPPLRLSYRTLGEIDVGLTHSIGVMLCGFMFQGAPFAHPFPWMVSTPLFLSIVPAIILAGIPDYSADQHHHKKTIAVRFGKKRAFLIALGTIILSMTISILWSFLPAYTELYLSSLYLIIPHGILLIFLILRTVVRPDIPERIDLLIALSLLYIFWFGLFPLLYILR